MRDLISRQAVDDAIYDYSRACDVDYAQIMEYIDKLPSAQPEPCGDVPDNNVGDMISRQAAIDALAEWHDVAITNRLNNLPPAQPSVSKTEIVGDVISRQAAIDALEKCHKQCCREDATGDEWIHYETTLNEVESIPPAPINDADCISRQAAIDALDCINGEVSRV